MSKYVSLAAAAAVATGLSFGGTNAEAATVSHFFSGFHPSGNDCPQYFGDGGFETCAVFIEDEDEGRVILSPVIAKWDDKRNDEDDPFFGISDINEGTFGSIDGSEFSVSETQDPTTWTYTQGLNDPDIRYWAVKQATGFTLFWDIGGGDASLCPVGDSFNLACLLLAQAVTSGSFDGDWSHITFYDSTSVIPLPAGLVLFLSGLAGIGFLGRYKAKRPEVPTA